MNLIFEQTAEVDGGVFVTTDDDVIAPYIYRWQFGGGRLLVAGEGWFHIDLMNALGDVPSIGGTVTIDPADHGYDAIFTAYVRDLTSVEEPVTEALARWLKDGAPLHGEA